MAYICDYCQIDCGSIRTWQEHQHWHKTMQTSVRPFSSESTSRPEKHRISRLESVFCPYCDLVLVRASVYRHVQNHHPQQPRPDVNSLPVAETSSWQYCERCGKNHYRVFACQGDTKSRSPSVLKKNNKPCELQSILSHVDKKLTIMCR